MRLFDHPNILKLVEVLHIPETDRVYLVLEYADMGSLAALIERRAALPLNSSLSIFKQAAGAIKCLHDAGYVHQDIKPGNILLDGSGRAILADFGIGHSFVSAAMVVGSPAYQAPEALDDGYAEEIVSDGAAPQKEDVWALGVTLYQTLFGVLPFVGSNLYEVVNAIKEKPLELPADTKPLVVDLIRGMLTIDPKTRFGIDEVLHHPVIVEAEIRASELPAPPPLKVCDGELQMLKAVVWREGVSLVEIAMGIRRRGSLRVCGFAVGRPHTAHTMEVLDKECVTEDGDDKVSWGTGDERNQSDPMEDRIQDEIYRR
jgi:serine/threonine-protein kinase 11